MLIYGVSGIFAHKKTIKQFLQPMIEQVLGAGGGGGCAAITGSELLYFCVSFFFNSPMPFFGSILPIVAYFLLYIMSQTVSWAQNFRDVQLIPNILRYPAWL